MEAERHLKKNISPVERRVELVDLWTIVRGMKQDARHFSDG